MESPHNLFSASHITNGPIHKLRLDLISSIWVTFKNDLIEQSVEFEPNQILTAMKPKTRLKGHISTK